MFPDHPWFEASLVAFNRNDFDGFGTYYADDVAFHGRAATLTGRDVVLVFYRGVKSRLDERVDLIGLVVSEALIAAKICTMAGALGDCVDVGRNPPQPQLTAVTARPKRGM